MLIMIYISLLILLAICAIIVWRKRAIAVKKAPILQELPLPEWAKSANIYEVNLRQYTQEGTFQAFQEHLPRLKEMGVDILWLMPIYPISAAKRKGTLGSYYAIADYKAVNPEHGTKEDFRALVQAIHALDMHVILDWVPNHTGWDHSWIKDHPNWYVYRNGAISHPYEDGKPTDWDDVAELNYSNKDMRMAMIDALQYWGTEFGIDGYRCDVAGEVPDFFWAEATEALTAVKKDIFMLAEAEKLTHRNNNYFHMSYGWELHHIMNKIAQGKMNVNAIDKWLQKDRAQFKRGLHMHFTSNHDENTWKGSVFERMGDGHKAFAILAATLDGMPLIYGGQEEPLNRQLQFFEKDNINFQNYAYADFYTTLLYFKKNNPALWNGRYGGEPIRINVSDYVYAYKRVKQDNCVIVILNLSNETQETELNEVIPEDMEDVFTGQVYSGKKVVLGAWEWVMLGKQYSTLHKKGRKIKI